MATLAVMAIVFERVATLLARAVRAVP